MTEQPRDELIDLLRNADPVDSSQLPTASSDQAQHVLENAMRQQDQPTIEDRTAAFTAVGSQGFNAPPQQEPKRTSRPAARRSYRFLAAAAAAVVVLVAGVMVFAPSNTAPALAAVQNAADETASLDSGRATTTFNAEGGDDTESGFLTGVFAAEFSGRNAAFTVDITDSSEQDLPDDASVETRLIGNVLYGNFDGEWFAIEADGLAATALSTFASYVDPRNVLATVQELVEAEEVGPATLDGLAVTHYRSVVDLGDETLAQSGWLAGMENLESFELDVEGEVTVDLYVDGDGFLRQLNVSGDLREPDGSGTADLTISTVFSDLNADITIEAPADVEIIDLSEELEGLDLEGLELDLEDAELGD